MNKILSLVLLFSSSCGIKVTSDPVQVNHKLTIDFDAISQYCAIVCQNQTDTLTCEEDCFTKIVNELK